MTAKQEATGYIAAEGRQVVWSMTEDEARNLAQWMREVLGPEDIALRDADALEAAADALIPLWAWTEPPE